MPLNCAACGQCQPQAYPSVPDPRNAHRRTSAPSMRDLEIIPKLETILEGVTEQLAFHRERVAQLEAQQATYAMYLAGYRNRLSHALRLPREILCEIMAIAASNAVSLEHKTEESLRVSRVCSTWRQTALSFPALWDTLVLSEDHRGLELQLTRAKSLPLSVRLFSDEDRQNEDHLRKSLKILIQKCDQWRMVEVWYLSRELSHMLSEVEGRVSALESIFLGGAYNDGDSSWGSTLPTGYTSSSRAFKVCPRLQELKIQKTFGRQLAKMDLPFPQLTAVWLNEQDFSACKTIFIRCPRLEILQLLDMDFAFDVTPDISFNLPHLKRLELQNGRGSALLFGILTAPALERLEIRVINRWCHDPIVSFLKSSPKLKDLWLFECILQFHESVDYLRLLPELMTLAITGPKTGWAELFAALIRTDNPATTLVPGLQKFNLAPGGAFSAQDATSLGHFLESRQAQNTDPRRNMGTIHFGDAQVDSSAWNILQVIKECGHCKVTGLTKKDEQLVA